MSTDNYQITLFIVVTTAIVSILATLTISLLYIHQKKKISYLDNLSKMKMDFEKNLLSTQVEIQEQTFQSISREIHDNISLTLTLAKLNLNMIDWTNPNCSHKTVNSSVDLLGRAISDLTHLSRSLNTEVIRNLGLMKAIQNEVDKLVEIAKLKVVYDIKGEPIFMDSEKEIVIFRIIQEAFNNILKHSRASEVQLELDYTANFLDILIKDNGIGFTRKNDSDLISAGMGNMKTRAKLFGGKLLLESIPQQGTQILISIPYK